MSMDDLKIKKPIIYPAKNIEELLQSPLGPVLENYLTVLSAADALLKRDGNSMQLPFGEVVPAAVSMLLEYAAGTACMMEKTGRYRFAPAEFAAAARRAAEYVRAANAGLILPANGGIVPREVQ